MNDLVVLPSEQLANELNFQQEQFAKEYIANGGNGTRAAMAAGYSVPAQTASRLIRDPKVRAYLDALRQEQREAQDMALRARHLTKDRILEELAVIAGFDLGECIVQGPDGPYLDASRIQGEHTRALAAIETERVSGPRGSRTTKVKIKTVDKLRALDMLMDHYGMKRQTQVAVQVNVDFGERMAMRRARALEDKG